MTACDELSVGIMAGYLFEPGGKDEQTGLAMPPQENAREWLGRKGLLGKNATTRMALCSAHALINICHADVQKGPATGVVVSSNFGNADIVLRDARILKREGEKALSPLDAATHSANITASSLAIRYSWKGPNVTVCSGTRSGRDALLVAKSLLTSGRCEQIVVIGVDDKIPAPFLLPEEVDRPLSAALLLGTGGGQSIDDVRDGSVNVRLPRHHGAHVIADTAALVWSGGLAHEARRQT